MKSVSECWNFIDDMMLCSVEKSVGIGNLEDISNYTIRMHNETYIGDMFAMSAILSQINLITEKTYLGKENDIKKR